MRTDMSEQEVWKWQKEKWKKNDDGFEQSRDLRIQERGTTRIPRDDNLTIFSIHIFENEKLWRPEIEEISEKKVPRIEIHDLNIVVRTRVKIQKDIDEELKRFQVQ